MNDPLSIPAPEPKITRKGKIGSLPLALRTEVNRRLENGQQGREILTWLNGEEAVRDVLGRLWAGKPVNAQNLSDWRRGGYRDWRRQREEVERLEWLTEYGAQLGVEATSQMAEGGAVLAAAKLLRSLQGASNEELPKLIEAVHRLRAGELGKQRLELLQQEVAQRERRELNR